MNIGFLSSPVTGCAIMASAEAPLAAVEEKNTKESGVLGRESGNAQSQLLSSTPIEMNDLSAVGQVASSSTAPQTSIFGGPTTTAESSLPHPDGALPESANDGSQGRNENVPQGRHTQLAPLNFQCEQREPLAPIPPNQPVSPIDASHPSLTRQKTAPQIGPATDKPLAPRESEVEGPFLYITLLLTTGERHPFRLDRKYLKKRGVQVENDNPINISLYKLKELILRDWREGNNVFVYMKTRERVLIYVPIQNGRRNHRAQNQYD